MKKLVVSGMGLALLASAGCTHSFPQVERHYVVDYNDVFAAVPTLAKQVDMKAETVQPEDGVIGLRAQRTLDMLITGSAHSLIVGDDVVVLVKSQSPRVTQVKIDSRIRSQIEPDFGRPSRNVKALVKVLDKKWKQADGAEGNSASAR